MKIFSIETIPTEMLKKWVAEYDQETAPKYAKMRQTDLMRHTTQWIKELRKEITKREQQPPQQPAPAEAAQPVAGDEAQTELETTYGSLNACRNEILALREQLAAVTSERDAALAVNLTLRHDLDLISDEYENLMEMLGGYTS